MTDDQLLALVSVYERMSVVDFLQYQIDNAAEVAEVITFLHRTGYMP